jgi:endo-1,4-beta-xylanase
MEPEAAGDVSRRERLRKTGQTRREFLAAAGMASAEVLAGCGHRVVRGGGKAGRHHIAPGVMGPESLRSHATARGLLNGCAVNVGALESVPEYAALVAEQSSLVVAENAMKWGRLRPTIDTYEFEQADKLIAFAEKHRIKVRGHNLCWHRQLPTWFEAEANTGNARRLLTEHIERVAGRYAGRMHSWDVVNEAVLVEDGRADGLRDSSWLRLVGEGYIEAAFHAARETDPTALLTYNEYGVEGEDAKSEAKRAAVLELLRRLRARNVPIDAVGVQSHLSAGPELKNQVGAGLVRFLAEVKELGLQVMITEMDVNDRALGADVAMRDVAVAGVYGRYLDLMLRDANVTAVVTWGITDKLTWLNTEGGRKDGVKERCLPFDEEMKPVEAFFAMRNCFDRRVKI